MSALKAQKKTLKQRQREEASRHLLKEAAMLFGTKGYEETTIDDIATAAVTSRATIYSYFKNKEEILRTIVLRLWDQAIPLYEEFGKLEEWNPETISDWVELVIEGWENEIEFLRVTGARFEHHDEVYLKYHEKYIDALMANTKLWKRFDPDEGRATALFLISGLELFLSTWIARKWRMSPNIAKKTIVNIWCNALKATSK